MLRPMFGPVRRPMCYVRELRNRTAEVISAVESGERVTLSVHGSAVAERTISVAGG